MDLQKLKKLLRDVAIAAFLFAAGWVTVNGLPF